MHEFARFECAAASVRTDGETLWCSFEPPVALGSFELVLGSHRVPLIGYPSQVQESADGVLSMQVTLDSATAEFVHTYNANVLLEMEWFRQFQDATRQLRTCAYTMWAAEQYSRGVKAVGCKILDRLMDANNK